MQSTQRLGGAIARVGLNRMRVLAATIALGAMGAAACGTAASSGTATAAAQGQSGTVVPGGLTVACGPGQQALVTQRVVNGQPTTAVECAGAIANAAPAAGVAAGGVNETAWPTAAAPMAAQPVALARPAAYTTDGDVLTYQPRPRPRVAVRKSGRTVQKSALIIGSSAGIGAGVGAAIGGKKGALIGAAIGGGGATIWDQATRRK